MSVFRLSLVVSLMAIILFGCDSEGGGDGYFFEDEVEEVEYVVEERVKTQEERDIEVALDEPQGVGSSSNIQLPEGLHPDSVPLAGDKEPEANTIKDLIDLVVTDGKLDTNKLKASIINTMMYISKQSLRPSFTCENLAYFGSNIMIPLEPNSKFTSKYMPMDMNGKRYHFIVLNYRGNVSGKNFVVKCNRNEFNYKELFVFYPAVESETQSSLLLAIADSYLTDVETLMNINWQVGGVDADYKDYGVVQFTLKKQIPS
ncbi:MAG: hypothetical protein ACPGEG_09025 [Salibacteraceae bacterium]